MAKGNTNQTPDPKDALKTAQDLYAIEEKLLEFNKKINSSFTGYIDGHQELLKLLELQRIAEQKISELQNPKDKLQKDTLKFYQNQQKFLDAALKTQKQQLDSVNLLKFAYDGLEKTFITMSGGFLSNLAEYMTSTDKAWRSLNQTIGLSGTRTDIMRNNLIEGASQVAILGGTYKDLTEIQANYNLQVGNVALLNSQNLTDIVAIGKGTKIGTTEASKMVGKFTQIGKSVSDIKKFYEDAVNESIKFGVSVDSVLQKFNENFDRAQSFSFKNGTRDLKDMAAYATKFNISMEGVFNAAEKTNSLEGVVDAVSNLQVLGGKFAQVDPFKILFDSRNDVLAFTKDIQGMTKDIATFNNETGEFTIGAGNLQRLKLASDALGISQEDLIKQAKAGAKISMIDGMLGGTNLTSEQKSFVEGIAQAQKGGKFSIQVDKQSVSDIRNLTSSQVTTLMGINKTLEDRAKDVQAFDETFKSTLESLKASALPILSIIADGLKWITSSPIGKFFTEAGVGLVLIGGAMGAIGKVIQPLSYVVGGLKNLPNILNKVNISNSSGKINSIGNTISTNDVKNVDQYGKSIQNSGDAAGSAWKNMLAFGGAVLLIGGGIWLATKGISSMATAIGGLRPEQLNSFNTALVTFGITIGVIVGVMAALAATGVLEVAVAGLLAFGGAVTLIGAGIGLAAAGIGYMAKGFGEMFDSLSKVTDPSVVNNLTGLVFGLTTLAASSLLFANPLAWIGLKVISSTIGDFSDKLSTLDFTNINSGANSFSQIADAIEKINDKKLDKLIEVSESLGSIGSLAAIFANLGNSLNDEIKVKFEDQIIPLTINLTAELDGQPITRILSKTIPLSIKSSQKGGST